MEREKTVGVGPGRGSPPGSGLALVVAAPGARLRRLAQLCFSKPTFATVFEPILDEMCDDYCAALSASDLVLARFVRCRGYGTFWLAAVGRLPAWLIKLFL